jgi:aspartyl-tRNA(Asn)/glutamyl-tRNA(Gln) amidotransferase subunit A
VQYLHRVVLEEQWHGLATWALPHESTPAARNTSPFNVYGWPTISIPCGFTRSGLPIGLQISGPSGGDAAVLRLAYAYEQATDWHARRPVTG